MWKRQRIVWNCSSQVAPEKLLVGDGVSHIIHVFIHFVKDAGGDSGECKGEHLLLVIDNYIY